MDVPVRHQRIIALLRERGFFAQFRHWAMGDTILVAESVRVEGEFEHLNRDFYLYPVDEDRWIIDTCGTIGGNSESPPMAESDMIEQAEKMLRSQEEYNRSQWNWCAENKWRGTTARRCPVCKSLWPENYERCSVCTRVAHR